MKKNKTTKMELKTPISFELNYYVVACDKQNNCFDIRERSEASLASIVDCEQDGLGFYEFDKDEKPIFTLCPFCLPKNCKLKFLIQSVHGLSQTYECPECETRYTATFDRKVAAYNLMVALGYKEIPTEELPTDEVAGEGLSDGKIISVENDISPTDITVKVDEQLLDLIRYNEEYIDLLTKELKEKEGYRTICEDNVEFKYGMLLKKRIKELKEKFKDIL